MGKWNRIPLSKAEKFMKIASELWEKGLAIYTAEGLDITDAGIKYVQKNYGNTDRARLLSAIFEFKEVNK